MKKTLSEGSKIILGIFAFFIVISWTPLSKNTTEAKVTTTDSLYTLHVNKIYTNAHLELTGLSPEVFQTALTGFYNLKYNGKLSEEKQILTIADLNQNSTKKRLWIIDLEKDSLLLNTWVAHGERSGDDMATRFSDVNNSKESSIGFYVTGEIYNGKHGRSMRLDGMDAGYNGNARSRAIVLHGASYVSQQTINKLGRLGRSHGCPAVAAELVNQVIGDIEGQTVLYINGGNKQLNSKYLNSQLAASTVLQKIDSMMIAHI